MAAFLCTPTGGSFQPLGFVMVTKYGYAVVEAEKEETALQKVSKMDDSEFDWSNPVDGQVLEDVMDFE